MKAIVMETRKNKAAVLLKDGTFRVIRGTFKVGDTIEYSGTRHPTVMRWVAAAAALVLLLGAGGGFWYDTHYVAYAEISLDVNPSIVYTVSKQSCVLDVRAVNEAAADLVSALEEAGVRSMPVSKAIETTMAICSDEGYLDAEDEDYVLMNVSTDDAGLQERLTSEIETGMEHAMKRRSAMAFRVDHSDRATADRASEHHMSTGRYAVWEQEGGEKKPEEYAEMPIREVMGAPAETISGIPEEENVPSPDENIQNEPSDEIREQKTPELSDRQPSDPDRLQPDPKQTDDAKATPEEPKREQELPLPEETGRGQEPSLPAEQSAPQEARPADVSGGGPGEAPGNPGIEPPK